MGGDIIQEEPQVTEQVVDYQVADDEEDLEPAEELVEEEDSDEEEVEQQIQVSYEEEETAIQPEVTTKPHSQDSNQEWMSGYEGQLNIDMYQTRDNVIIKSTIAGVRPEDVDITVANDMITIKGSRKKEENIPTEDYFYQECYWGTFTRSVIIPVDIDSENIEADLKDGILTVVVPKAAKAKTKKVRVKGL